MVRERVLTLAAVAVLLFGLVAALVQSAEGDDVALESERTTTTGEVTTTTGDPDGELERSTTTTGGATTTAPSTSTSTTDATTTSTTGPSTTTTAGGSSTTSPPVTTAPPPTSGPLPPPPTTVPTSADLEIFTTVTPDGDGFLVRLRVANNGPHASGVFVVNLRNPDGGLTFSEVTERPECDAVSTHAQCVGPSTGRGGRIFEVVFRATPAGCGAATIVSEVGSETVGDPQPQNNSDTFRVPC